MATRCIDPLALGPISQLCLGKAATPMSPTTHSDIRIDPHEIGATAPARINPASNRIEPTASASTPVRKAQPPAV